MAHEDPQAGMPGETLCDPAVVLAADFALVDVGLRRVHGDERDLETVRVESHPRVAGPELVLVAEVADVARIVVARDEDDLGTLDRAELLARLGVLVGI